MEEDTEYKKLPVDERCVHKLWKARVDGYEEAAKLFRTIDDEKAPEWNKYLGLVKKFVVDTNVMAQEKGLEATLIFVENCGNAGKTVGEVISGIILKCMGSPKAKTKDLAVQITLMYIEIERHETVLEELLKGTDQKNPKIVATCISTMTTALREFGTKVVNVKPIVKKLQTLLSDRDKTVRDEAKSLTIEMYRWIGPAFKTQIASLPQVMLTELEGEFEKVKNEKAVPTRYLRSQQEKQAAIAAQAENDGDGDGEGGADEADDAEEIDPMDLIDPVDILSKLPKDFYEKLEAKKWQERKESLEALEPLVANPKLQAGDYGDLVRALKKVITKDTNVVLVAMAGKCLASLAKGLAKKFQPYGVSCVQGILEKFKEKKPNVVAALREAIDAIYPSISLEVIQEDLIEALNNKNPAVKSETASFIARSLTKTQPSVLSKKLLKALVTALLKTLNESDPVVRDSAADALGTFCKLCGDKAIAPYLTEVDALKQAKIKEFTEKAVITVKIVGAKKERPATAPAKPPAAPKGGSTEPKPVTRPQTSAVAKKPAAGIKKSASSNNNAAKTSAGGAKAALPTERDMTPEEVDEKASEILPPDVCSGLVDSNWKTRLSAVESFQQAITEIEAGQGVSQTLIRTMAKKPGLKDNNFQVLKIRLMIIQQISEKFGITTTSAEYIINDIAEKLGDPKNSAAAALALQAIVDGIKLEWVVSRVMSFAFEQKSPKVQQEILNWVNQSIKDYGFQVNAKQLLDDVRKAVQSVNPAVRSAGIGLVGTMYLYMGNTLTMFFDSEKPALKQQIMQEFEKYAGQKAPAPSRGVSKSSSKASFGNDDDGAAEDEAADEPEPVNIGDIIPRVDISGQITEALLNEISDKNWKTRNEGLDKVKSIISDAKLIKSNLGDLPQALAQRLMDSNAKIAQTALEIGQQIATAMGPACKIHVTTLFPGFFKSLGDSKAYIRTAGITCINTWCDQCGYKEVFSGEMIADALKTGSPALKTELWGWLAEKLPNIPTKTIQKEELIATLPYLYACLIDRSADVRRNAGEAVLGIMIHIGYDAMMKVCEKQKPASKKDIQAALDKARPNLPVKPLPKGKQQAPIVEDAPKSIKTGVARGQKVVVSKPGAAPTRAKKEEEVDLSPLLAINNTKSQRLLDEQKLKVLKWSFTTPREEFIDLLKDQMTTANVNKGLMANMFHEDFRYHLKVIESLIDDLNENIRGLECNLDLVLKWISLRFYDTNPSVLLKGLEYLNQAFQILVENGYNMTENEGSCFIPHLLTKIGDPKDVVRNGVHTLLREICLVYPHTKIFSYLMDALKSKNARQRTECLDELGYLIEQYGITVCQPTPQAALKEIAKNISDRDNSVRNAALNTVVQAYFLAGDKIYKMIGQISEKDASMLEERIKRTKRPVKKVEPPPQPKAIAVAVPQQEPEEEMDDMPADDELPSESDLPPTNTRTYEIQPAQPMRVTGPFGLDPTVIEDIERDWVKSHQLKKTEFKPIDMTFMEKPLKTDERYPISKLEKLMCHSSPQRTQTGGAVYNMSPLQGAQTTTMRHLQMQSPHQSPNVSLDRSNTITLPPRNDPTMTKLINNIASSDPTLAQAALIEMGDLLENKEKSILLKDFEVQYIDSILLQYKHLSKRPVAEALALYQPLLHSTYAFFLAPKLGKNLPINSIKQIMSVLLGLMADNKLDGVDDPQYMKVINGICLKVLDATNFTNLNCALIRLLKETCSTSALPKFTELLMKCIWRNVKVLPERLDELDYDAVLSEINEFLIFLPSTWWQQRPSDTPLRTIRTIIHNMTKIKGNAILVHVQNISAASELHQYVLKVLKKEAQSGNLTDNTNPNPAREKRLSRSIHEQVTNIFKLISDKETSQEGLSQLYDLKTKNPEVDITSLLKGANPTFQKFITDALAEIERERTGCDNKSGGDVTRPAAPDQWMERLNALKQKANMASKGPSEQMTHAMVDNKIADENLNMNQFQNAKAAANRAHPNVSASRLNLLQEQLAKLKQGGPS
ncbi:protein mini spindles isoform X2 [Culicoides brevitarsis]|uniref:protein mini spindles isoform X2 n=1 Tax=Culicoides brevitarsis TaxID=469753 RepID=UPI00307BAAC9